MVENLYHFFLNVWEFISALIWAWCFPLQKAVIIDSISVINMGQSRLSISSCVSFSRLCLSRNESILPYQICCYQICCCCLVVKSCPTLCDPMDRDARLPCPSPSPGANSLCQWYYPAISSSVPPSPPAPSPSQHQGLFQWAGSSHQEAKGFKLQL